MTSELHLTRTRVRDLVPCPVCDVAAGRWCERNDIEKGTRPNHQARVDAARAVVRARRLDREEETGG